MLVVDDSHAFLPLSVFISSLADSATQFAATYSTVEFISLIIICPAKSMEKTIRFMDAIVEASCLGNNKGDYLSDSSGCLN